MIRSGLIGTKIGNSSYYYEDGKNTHVTVVKVDECIVSNVKTFEKDGYNAVQLASIETEKDISNINKPQRKIFSSIKIKPKNKLIPYDIFNLGNGKSINLKVFLKELQSQLKQTTKVKFLKKQQGDTFKTHSNIKKAKKILKFKPKVNYKKGISSFIKWYKDFYK